MNQEMIDLLIDLLIEHGPRGVPLSVAKKELIELLQANGEEDIDIIIEQAIQYALDKWMIDKILDYPADGSGEHVWFLRVLDKTESDFLQSLREEEKAFLKLLRESETNERLGAMREDDIFQRLKALGFDLEFVPFIPGKTDDSFISEEEDTVAWHYLIPQDELTEEHKAAMKEQDRKVWEKELRFMHAAKRDEREAAKKRKAKK